MAVEEGVIHYRIPLSGRGAIEQQFDGVITFTIEWGKEENEDTQHPSAKG